MSGDVEPRRSHFPVPTLYFLFFAFICLHFSLSTFHLPLSAESQFPPAPATALILGQVVDAGSGRPVAGAIVGIQGFLPPPPVVAGRGGALPAPLPRALTDGDGRFLFRGVPRGSYGFYATKAGYVDGAYGRFRPNGPSQALDLADGERRA